MNGYTGIFEKKQPTFADFVWRCARAFGPLIHMRDDSHDTPIYKPKEDTFGSTFEERRLPEERKELAKYQAMTDAEADRLCEETFKAEMQRYRDEQLKVKVLRTRFEKVLKEAEAWVPPTDGHRHLKAFMIEQIKESIKRDCEEPRKPERQKGAAWRKCMIECCEASIKRYTERLEEQKRERERGDRIDPNAWIDQLHASVPCPTGAPKFR